METRGKRKRTVAVAGKTFLAAVDCKLRLLRGNLRFILPSAGAHLPDPLLRSLGLHDFARLDLSSSPLRSDLLLPLIASYHPDRRASHVLSAPIAVSRSALAQALSLPLHPPQVPLPDAPARGIVEFVLDRMVFLDDGCELPAEVVAAIEMVRDGQPGMVDWAGMIWTMVERELLDAPSSGRCYYGLHLQRLIMHQRPDLFESTAGVRPQTEVVVVDDEDGNMACDNHCNGEQEVVVVEPEVDKVGTLKMTSFEESDGSELNVASAGRSNDVSATECGGIVALTAASCDLEEFEGVGFSLGLSSEGNTMLHLTDSSGEEEQHWLAGTGHCQQRCSLNDVTDTKCDYVERSAEEYANEDPRVTEDPSATALSDAEAKAHEKMEASPILFRRGSMRKINATDVKDNGDDGYRLSQGGERKRTRHHEPLPTFDACLKQVQCWMDKAKMVHAEKEQACIDLQSDVQYLSSMLQRKDQVIRFLEKEKMKEEEKRKLEASRFEHDLKLMSSLVHCYKKALRKTRKKFAEYRNKVYQDDEPLHKDVGGVVGLSLSTPEPERPSFEKEDVQ